MTAIQNYSTIIDSIYGIGTTTFDISKNFTNKVIGALNSRSQVNNFKTNFISRLERLRSIYSTHPTYLADILFKVNDIARNKNWRGAFAELAAYDYLNSDILNHKNYIVTPIRPNITLPNTKSFAFELGKHKANLDGYVEDCPMYFDVKCFKDNVTEILEGIYKDLKKYIGINDLHITAEYELDISYDDFKFKRTKLLEELKSQLNITTKKTYISSKVIPNLTYRILWCSGIMTAVRTFEPFRYAKNYHKTIFNYSDKFIKDKPTVIVLVVFPWYNMIDSYFTGDNIKFYRAFSRRVFCQYKLDTTKFNSFNSSFTGNQTLYEVSKHLSGIIFLEDNTVEGTNPNDTNIKSFIYLNPNAIKPITKSWAREFIFSLPYTAFDDFENDNY
ncbi:MAG: hypothetical protein ABSG15_00815 [FCB group bacterium]|jgi:hypothetical protein